MSLARDPNSEVKWNFKNYPNWFPDTALFAVCALNSLIELESCVRLGGAVHWVFNKHIAQVTGTSTFSRVKKERRGKISQIWLGSLLIGVREVLI